MSESTLTTRTGFLAAAAILAACSLTYELTFAKVVAEMTGNATIWESVSMAVFLCGMGLRSLAFRDEDAEVLQDRLVRTELGLIAAALLSYVLLFVCQMAYRDYVYDGGILRDMWAFPPVFVLGIVGQLALFVLGWFTAFELQFFLHWSRAPRFRFKESAVLAAYHFGALFGTMAFVGAHRLGVGPFPVLVATVLLNLAFAVYMMHGVGLLRAYWRTTSLLLLLLGSTLAFEGPLEQIVLKNHYNNQFDWRFDRHGLKQVTHPLGPWDFLKQAAEIPPVRRLRSPFQVIDLVQEKRTQTSSLFINGRFQVGASSAARYHETFAHVSLGYKLGATKRVLILGGGDGILASELLKYPSFEGIDMVEIDPVVLDLARTDPDLRDLNHGALDDPRVKIHVTDAMAFVRERKSTYDAIFIDLTYPYDFDSARFFSVEFFRMIQRDLVPGGILVGGLPFDLVEPEDPALQDTVESTLAAAGFARYVGYSNGNDHFVVVARDELAPTYHLDPGIAAPALANLKIRTTLVEAPKPGRSVLSVMRPKLLMTYDSFY